MLEVEVVEHILCYVGIVALAIINLIELCCSCAIMLIGILRCRQAHGYHTLPLDPGRDDDVIRIVAFGWKS